MGANAATMINGSRYHTTLCYAKVFKSRAITPQEVADCLVGSYPRRRTAVADVRLTLKKLAKMGYVVKVGEDLWCITQRGVIQVYDMAEFFKKTRVKMIGLAFMEEMNAKLSKCSQNIFEIDMDKPDYEDEILEKIYVQFKETSEARARRYAESKVRYAEEKKKSEKKSKSTRKS